jgi:hypothetical protein
MWLLGVHGARAGGAGPARPGPARRGARRLGAWACAAGGGAGPRGAQSAGARLRRPASGLSSAGPARSPPRAAAAPLVPAGCGEALAEFDAAARGAQAVVKYGTLDASGAGALQRRLLAAMGVDAAALAAAPCGVQAVLLPHGRAKADLDEYKRWGGH